MVHLSFINFVCKTGYDRTLKRHKIFRFAGKFYGRKRNCYSIAVRSVLKSFVQATESRKLQSEYDHGLRFQRISAACAEHDMTYKLLSTNLIKCNVQLDLKVLVDLAIWEPRTFKCLIDLAKMKNKLEAPSEIQEFITKPEGVITRGML